MDGPPRFGWPVSLRTVPLEGAPVKGNTRSGAAVLYAAATTHYDVLGVTPSSTHEEVRQAYIGCALRHHPDRQEDQDIAGRAEAERRMQDANAAWEVLGDREARAVYDAEIAPATDIAADAEAGESLLPPVDLRAALRRFRPVLVVLAVLVAVFVFTAYAGTAPK
jgi:hypothetical protein